MNGMPAWYYHSLESRLKRRQAAGTAASARAAARRRSRSQSQSRKAEALTQIERAYDPRIRGPVCPRCMGTFLREALATRAMTGSR